MAGRQTDAAPPRPADVPRWLREIVAQLGEPEIDHHGTMRRWLWRDGDAGVVLDKHTHVWQLVVFGPACSVTVRTITEPTDPEIRMAAALADLSTRGDGWQAW